MHRQRRRCSATCSALLAAAWLVAASWWSLPPVAASGRADLTRAALFMKGAVQTTRDGDAIRGPRAPRPGSRLLQVDGAAAEQHLWLLGLHPAHQEAVQAALGGGASTAGGQVLHALPGTTHSNHHWIIRASQDAVQQLLDAHEDVTAAALPAEMKVSTGVDEAVRLCREKGVAACASELASDLRLSFCGTHARATLLVSTGGVADGAMAQLAQQAQAQLRQLLLGRSGAEGGAVGVRTGPACLPTVKRSGTSLAVTGVCLEDLGPVAATLSQAVEVTWVEVEPRAQLTDLFSAADQQQSPSAWQPDGSWPAPGFDGAQLRPFWQAGLDGAGQVVGVVDSGMDLDSCFLWDPAQNDYQSGSNTSNGVYLNTAARKVAMYVMGQDAIDDSGSHGTHVATSIVGSAYGTDPLTQPDMATGVAPGAQVAFVDVGYTYSNGSGDAELNFEAFTRLTDMYDYVAQAGAAITSNSWGSAKTYSYTHATCTQLDAHAWDNPAMLQIFAAGNDGTDTSRLTSTGSVTVPGTCKNVLTVGASENYVLQGRSDLRTISELVIDLRTSDGAQVQLAPSNFSGPYQRGALLLQDAADGSTLFTLRPTRLQGFDSRMANLGNSTCQVALADPIDACSATSTSSVTLSSTSDSSQCLFLVVQLSSSCAIETALDFVTADSRVRGAYFFSTSQATLDSVALSDITVDNPALNGFAAGVGANATVGSFLLDYLQNSVAMQAVFSPPDAQEPAPTENVAYFSSYGSAQAFGPDTDRSWWYRIKPDLVAPGYIQAGHSDGQFSAQQDQCATFTLAGTSMATPQVTGAVTLARQYFMDGFYPTGAKVAENGFTPTAALLRAVLTAGAQPLTGISSSTGDSLDPPPSPFQGFGKVALWASLPLAGATNAPGLQVVNYALLRQGANHTYSISVADGGQALSVVLAFQDWPSFSGARVSYVNDLDLEVTAPDGTQLFPNGRQSADPVNNVEKVYVASPSAGTYTISVRASYVFARAQAQPYALAVLGPLASDAQLANITDGSPAPVATRSPPSSSQPGPPGSTRSPPSFDLPPPRPPDSVINLPGTSPGPPGPGSGATLPDLFPLLRALPLALAAVLLRAQW